MERLLIGDFWTFWLLWHTIWEWLLYLTCGLGRCFCSRAPECMNKGTGTQVAWHLAILQRVRWPGVQRRTGCQQISALTSSWTPGQVCPCDMEGIHHFWSTQERSQNVLSLPWVSGLHLGLCCIQSLTQSLFKRLGDLKRWDIWGCIHTYPGWGSRPVSRTKLPKHLISALHSWRTSVIRDRWIMSVNLQESWDSSC